MNKILENPDVVNSQQWERPDQVLEYVESFLHLILKDLKKILQRDLF